ncbi:MAG: 2-amino-4-hydroxy-6-hydroxymethyldihydropteridine diphosphokinase [Gammaproteobacteria bacterium]|nr:2-amino-4-hydroxy-6-hydroxymethyldihydropteridine diphosphokinase [Gammaproteobacteria bacterium]MDH5693843.1 2-amino-4-hydroxy-6-hydroxymethyldihydropteridine diphosphokinase [Gammaproteobacteria bacterium]
MARIYISIGSNIDRERHIRSGIEALNRHFRNLRLSPVYENPAVGFEGEPFLNLAAQADSDMSALEVQTCLNRIEEQNGRTRQEAKFSPRTLDLDLLLYDDQVIEEGKLRLPRKDIEKYAFVLRPLLDLQEDLVNPVNGLAYSQIWETMGNQEGSLRRVELELGQKATV